MRRKLQRQVTGSPFYSRYQSLLRLAGMPSSFHLFRSIAAPALVLWGGGCAHIEPPTGGPEDLVAPTIISTQPMDAVVDSAFRGAVRFRFSERISEQNLQDAVSVSPRTSPVEIRHGRDEIRVSLRRGWEPGLIYHVTVLPVVRDLFNNSLSGAETLVFSTGPEIPPTEVTGQVLDRITGRPMPGSRVEAIRTADSLVYAAATDSAGTFVIERFPEGDYQIRAFTDLNRSRAIEIFEPRDSTNRTVRVGENIQVVLEILLPDSTPAAMGMVRPDSASIQIEFDDYLDPAQTIDSTAVTLTHPTLGAVTVGGPTVAPPVPDGGPGQARNQPAAPGPQRPSRILIVPLAAGVALEPSTEYTVAVRGIRNVNGIAGDAEGEFTTPAPQPPPPDQIPPDPAPAQ